MHQTTSGAADLSAPGDLSSSAASFARYLRAANVAPATLKTYAEAVRTIGGFLADRGMPTDVATGADGACTLRGMPKMDR